MLDGAFSFRGRIGRLKFFLDSFALSVICGFGAIAIAMLVYPARNAEMGLAFLVVCLVVALPMVLWVSLSLQARRLRDIGLNPVYVLPVWVALSVADPVLARLVPSIAAPGAHGTVPLALLNLVLMLAMLFWPGTDGDESMPRPTAKTTRAQTFDRPAVDAPLLRSPAVSRQQGFGRRGLR